MPDVEQMERDVLAVFVRLQADDPPGSWAAYHTDVLAAAGGVFTWAVQVCRKLRERKLLAGMGRGNDAYYWPTDKGIAKHAKNNPTENPTP